MAAPLVWLVSDAGKVTGRRFLGVHWDPALPPEQAAEGWGARGMDEHRDNAEHAEPLLAHIEPWRRGNNVPPSRRG